MPTRSMLSESKPWLSIFTPCLVPLKVSSSTCLCIFDFCCTCVLFVTCLLFSICAEFTGVSPSALQTDDDPLMNTVNLLEENWISI
jgi:hypothetical protein